MVRWFEMGCGRSQRGLGMRGARAAREGEGRRWEASGDRPATSKRRRVGQASSAGLYQRLTEREIDQKVSRSFARRSTRERFSNLQLRLSLDMYARSASLTGLETMMERRYRVEEICSAGDMVFGLTENGICCAFERLLGRRTCILNKDSSEVVRSLFHNKSNGTLITVSVESHDLYTSLRCRATPLDSLRSGDISSRVRLFEAESLRWPGFVEFDDVNGIVLTFSATDSVYKVWSMQDPTKVLYHLPDSNIEEIKISPGIMMIMRTNEEGLLPLQVRCIETGKVLSEVRQEIEKDKRIDVVEQFNEKLILKQEQSPVRIIDLLNGSVVQLTNQEFRKPVAFIFLYEYNCFLAFESNTVTVWDFTGNLVRHFEDHALWFPYPGLDYTSVIYITQAQDVIISICQDGAVNSNGSVDGDPSSSHISIHISSINTGRCLARIDPKRASDPKISALCYNETYGEIITGNENGVLQIWSN